MNKVGDIHHNSDLLESIVDEHVSDEKLFKEKEERMNSIFNKILSIEELELSDKIQQMNEIVQNIKDSKQNEIEFDENNLIEQHIIILMELFCENHGNELGILSITILSELLSFNLSNEIKENIFDSFQRNNFIYNLWFFISNKRLSTKEIIEVFNLIATIYRYSEQLRAHIIELFPIPFILEIFINSDDDVKKPLSILLAIICYFPIEDPGFHNELTTNIIQLLETINDGKLNSGDYAKINILDGLYQCIKNSLECSEELIQSTVSLSLDFLGYHNKCIKALAIKIITLIYQETQSEILINQIPISYLISLVLEYPETWNKTSDEILCKSCIKLLRILSEMSSLLISVLCECEDIIFKLGWLLENSPIKLRESCAKLCLSLIKEENEDIMEAFIENQYITKISDFLDDDRIEFQLIALQFICNLLEFSKTNELSSNVLNQLDEISYSIYDLQESQNEEILNFASHLIENLETK